MTVSTITAIYSVEAIYPVPAVRAIDAMFAIKSGATIITLLALLALRSTNLGQQLILIASDLALNHSDSISRGLLCR